MIGAWSDHDPTCNWKNIAFRAPALIPDFTKYCAYHEKWPLMDLPPKMSRTIDPERSFTICGAKMSPSNLTKYCACHEKWFACLSLMTYERHLHCAEQQMSPSNLTKYCACRGTWHSQNARKIFRCGDDPSMIRSQPREIFVLSANIFYGNIKGFALRLPFQISSNTATATKSDARISPNSAPATKRDLRTSPNNAHATKRTLELHQVLHLPAKVTPDSSIVDSIAWLYYYLTILLYLTLPLLGNSSTCRCYYLTVLLLDASIAWRFYCLSLFLLDDSITWSFYYLRTLLLDDSITWLCYSLLCDAVRIWEVSHLNFVC